MLVFNEEAHEARKEELMKKCYECFAENGLSSTGIRTLGKSCGCNPATLYLYFKDLDDLIIQSTEYCMSKVEDEFMERTPKNVSDLEKFINETPYWTAEEHGKKYRLMYQVYTHPKYREYGKKFFEGVNKRYTEYANQLSEKIKIPSDTLTSLIFIFVRACVHYALFEDEFYLQEQLRFIKQSIYLNSTT
ncbi:MAG: TetR/AcrR family transcriptional regulator [Clostridia bacterium]